MNLNRICHNISVKVKHNIFGKMIDKKQTNKQKNVKVVIA